MNDYTEKDQNIYFRIMDAFLQQYSEESLQGKQVLDHWDDRARRSDLSKVAPNAAQFLDVNTREELETKTMILAIASSCARAVTEGCRILRQEISPK